MIDRPMMDTARWTRIQALFNNVVDLPRSTHQSFLEHECTDDPTLIPQVLAMVEEDARADSLLDRDVAADPVRAGPLDCPAATAGADRPGRAEQRHPGADG